MQQKDPVFPFILLVCFLYAGIETTDVKNSQSAVFVDSCYFVVVVAVVVIEVCHSTSGEVTVLFFYHVASGT